MDRDLIIEMELDKLQKENEQLKEERETNSNFISELQNDLLTLITQNKELNNKLNEAVKELDRVIAFCENDSQGAYDVCNMAIRNYKNIKKILGDNGLNE